MAMRSNRSGQGGKSNDLMPLKPLKFKKPANTTVVECTGLGTDLGSTFNKQSKEKSSVGDSLNAFIASRSNSAAKRRSPSQNLSNDEDQLQQPRTLTRNQSGDRALKYLRSSATLPEADRVGRDQSEDREVKPPRSAKSQAAGKQVRFDIKDGLRDMIRDTQFDITQVRNRAIEKRMAREGKVRDETNQESIKIAAKPPPRATKGPPAQNKSMEKRSAKADGNGSVRSPPSTTRKQSLKLALMYKRENLENQHRRGEMQQPNSSRGVNTMQSETTSPRMTQPDEQEVPDTPVINPVLPPLPTEHPEQAANPDQKTDHRRIQSLNSYRDRSESVPKQERKVGSICRMRSASPIHHAPARASQAAPPILADAVAQAEEEKENQSMNRTFFAGQIVKLQNKSQPQTQRLQAAPNFSVEKDHDQGHSNQYVETVQEARSPPSFAGASAPSLEGHQYKDDYIRTSGGETECIPSSRTAMTRKSDKNEAPNILIEAAFQQRIPTETTQPDLLESVETETQEYSSTLFNNLWDSFKVSEIEFLSSADKFTQVIEASKQALHEPLKQDTSLPTHRETHRMRELLEPSERLRIIRVNLRNALMDSFLPLIHEIIQLRDKLAYRKDSYKYAIKQPLKASIISDICSRLRQKIVLKTLFLKSQFKKNIRSLFQAYFDLLVKKRVYIVTFDCLKNFKQRKLEKQTYQDYAEGQLLDLKKMQVFDCWKRLKQVQALEQEKQTQAVHKIQVSRLLKVVNTWRVMAVATRESQIGNKMAEGFYRMKMRHQLFAKWYNSHKMNYKIKEKAIRMATNQAERAYLGETCTDSQLSTHRSTTSFESTAAAELWLKEINAKSEEVFYSQAQQLILEKEHLHTLRREIRAQVSSEALTTRIPLKFDTCRNEGAWQQAPSQALVSNREQIYIMYPELQPRMTPCPSRPVPVHTLPDGATQQTRLRDDHETVEKAIQPVDLTAALQPTLQRIMQPQPDTQATMSQQLMLGVKLDVHRALVQQQNLYPNGLKTVSKETMATVTIDCAQRQSIEVGSPKRRTVTPFKANQQSKVKVTNGDKVPNMLFRKLQNQLEQQSTKQGLQTEKLQDGATPQLPVEIQLALHIKSLLSMIRECNTQGNGLDQSDAMVRAKSLAYALNHGSEEPVDNSSTQPLPLTDYIQVALQSRVSLLQLNQCQTQYRMITRWRLALISHLLLKDLGIFQSYHKGRQAIKAWRVLIQKRKQKAQSHWKTKQMQKFYSLFQKWAKGNRQLMYEEEKKVRQFRARLVLGKWRSFSTDANNSRKAERLAVQFYSHSLHTKALVALYQNSFKLTVIKKFQRRQAFLKFFKRKWMIKAKQRQLLRDVLLKFIAKEERHQKSRYQRQLDLMQSYILKWRKQVQKHRKLVHTSIALNHYCDSLKYQAFRVLKAAPRHRAGLEWLSTFFKARALQPSFESFKQACMSESDQRVAEHKAQRNFYIAQKIVQVWHTNTVKQKIAKMFFQRKYLNAFQEHILKKNYMVPLNMREHNLKMKAFVAFQDTKHLRRREERQELILRALATKTVNRLKQQCFLSLVDNILKQRKKRLIMGTVVDFRKHTLAEKTFRYWKIFIMQRRKTNLMKQVASEYYEERLIRLIEHGRTQVRINTQSGVLLNANQDLLLRVLTEWRQSTRWQKQNKFRVDQVLQSKRQLLMLKCFLSWRALSRYAQSELSCSDIATRRNKRGSDLEMIQSYEMTPSHAHTASIQEEYFGSQVSVDMRQQKVSDIMQRYGAGPSGQSSQGDPMSEIHQIQRQSEQATSFVNTDHASPLFYKNEVVASYEHTESRVTSRENNRAGSAEPGHSNEQSGSTLNQRAGRDAHQQSKASEMPMDPQRKSELLVHTSTEGGRVSSLSHVTPGMYQDTQSDLGGGGTQGMSRDRHNSSSHSALEALNLPKQLVSTQIPTVDDYATFNANQHKSVNEQFNQTSDLSSASRISDGRHNQSLDYYSKPAHNHASITLTNKTDLYDELQSIFNHNKEWMEEQHQREKLLKKMADYYETSLTQGNNETINKPDDSYIEYQQPIKEMDEETEQVNPMDSQIN